ncbi:PspC domain-containing protein [Saccharopolyspora sp. NPDC047091]|uniref:PspC domain-containing protein n=1 Tax=Saccharopolyspora sp. NPDC047091 TaxID=3155924 RepID=UPI0034044AD7
MTETTHQHTTATDPGGAATGTATDPTGPATDFAGPTAHFAGSTTDSAGQATDSTAQAEPRRFRRHRDGMIAGVCGGAADLLGIDATLIRVGLVAATILGFGTGILLYLVCWVLVPQD